MEVTTQVTTCESVEGADVKGAKTEKPQEVITDEIATGIFRNLANALPRSVHAR